MTAYLFRAARVHDAWAGVPLLGSLQKKRYLRYFDHAGGQQLYRGVFDSFESAQASAPATKPISYDNTASAELYLQHLRHDAFDYPALFWIERSLSDGMRTVFDVGGSIGIKYFAFSRLIPFPPDLRWTVEDMPAVAERGRAFAAERGVAHQLSFTADFGDCDGKDVLYASGALQYLPKSLGELLGMLVRKPRRIVVNTTPIHPTLSFFTLNNIGTAFCPYRVQSHAQFVREVTQHGYELRDHWQNVGKAMRIPFEAAHDVEAYSGYCFDLR
jgi:putative methyltransferase (TIGR04325 family)